MAETPAEDLFSFPCDHVFKVIGPTGEAFIEQVLTAVGRVVPVGRDSLKIRPSSQARYQALSVVVRLHAYPQLVAIYRELRQIETLHYLL